MTSPNEPASETPLTDDTFDSYCRGACGTAYIRNTMGKMERELAAARVEVERQTTRNQWLEEYTPKTNLGLIAQLSARDEDKALRKQLRVRTDEGQAP
jgi:hypothetical protein